MRVLGAQSVEKWIHLVTPKQIRIDFMEALESQPNNSLDTKSPPNSMLNAGVHRGCKKKKRSCAQKRKSFTTRMGKKKRPYKQSWSKRKRLREENRMTPFLTLTSFINLVFRTRAQGPANLVVAPLVAMEKKMSSPHRHLRYVNMARMTLPVVNSTSSRHQFFFLSEARF
jgi:hypothetical protein